MNIELKGRKAIITGSTAGIGRATAEGLARAGASGPRATSATQNRRLAWQSVKSYPMTALVSERQPVHHGRDYSPDNMADEGALRATAG